MPETLLATRVAHTALWELDRCGSVCVGCRADPSPACEAHLESRTRQCLGLPTFTLQRRSPCFMTIVILYSFCAQFTGLALGGSQ